jgi:hypothetical protein
MLGLDRGPGIENVTASLRDGESTAGSSGHGLGALARLSSSFEIYTQPRQGTALRIVCWAQPVKAPAHEIGVVCVAKAGESVSGDGWAAHLDAQFATVLVSDGIGHGPEAARASRAATRVLVEHPTATTGRLLDECHAALSPTRGAAVAAARIDAGSAQGTFAGIGNIVARVLHDGDQRNLVSHNGTVGHNVRRVQEFGFQFGPGTLLVMHSDGVDTRWNLATDYPGLAARHPGLIAGVLYRDHDRGRDDVTVLVLRTARGSRA